jgi:hypothetical protein
VFLLTVALVGLCEILIYVPTVANYRVMWLSDRIAAAYVAALVVDASPGQTAPNDFIDRLLTGVGASAVIVSGETRKVIARETPPDTVSHVVDLQSNGWTHSIAGAWSTLFQPAQGPIRVIGKRRDGFAPVEIILDETPLRRAMVKFCLRLLGTSMIVAAVVAGLVFLVLQRVIVRPVRLLVSNITAFAGDPEATNRVIVPSGRNDEVGDAEVALAQMEMALAEELRAKRHLADLGLSVSKINHEMRNLLTTAQLLGDRLEGVTDPVVQRVAPRLRPGDGAPPPEADVSPGSTPGGSGRPVRSRAELPRRFSGDLRARHHSPRRSRAALPGPGQPRAQCRGGDASRTIVYAPCYP